MSKVTNTTYVCDVCGRMMPHPALVPDASTRGYAYRITIRRRDRSLEKGAYRPPFRLCHVCYDCRLKMAALLEGAKEPNDD